MLSTARVRRPGAGSYVASTNGQHLRSTSSVVSSRPWGRSAPNSAMTLPLALETRDVQCGWASVRAQGSKGLRARMIGRGGVFVDAVGLADLDSPRARRRREQSRNSASVSAPAMQPVHAAMSARVCSSMSGSAITSETANRPPGRRTRAASRITGGLSPERLITQLEMTTSTISSSSGHVLEVALEELDVLDAGLGGVGARELEHLVGHVEPDRLAGRPDAPGGDQDVGAGARAEVKDGLALVQIGDGGRARRSRATRSTAASGTSLVGRPRRTARAPKTPVASAGLQP